MVFLIYVNKQGRDEMEKEMLYIRIGKTTKDAIEILKEITGEDSNQVFYRVLQQNGIEIDQQKIDNIFANVNTAKLKAEIYVTRLKQLQDELKAKLNLNQDDIAKIMQ